MNPAPTLAEVFDIKPVVAADDFVLQLHSGVDHAEQTVSDYVVTKPLADAFQEALGYVGSAVSVVEGERMNRGVFLDGDFGSGKSHFMAMLDLLLQRNPAALSAKGLQAAVSKNQELLRRNLLTVEYHMIGAKSLEERLFSGYLAKIQDRHPDVVPPMLHNSEALFRDAANRRRQDETAFFANLNQGQPAASGWGALQTDWTPDNYDAAESAQVGDPERDRLIADLSSTMFAGYQAAGEWLDIEAGLAVMTEHAKSLGYEGIVLFLDELVLWLAAHLADQDFVRNEGSKVAKLVESGQGDRAVPIISFVARQRELQTFYADTSGADQGGAQHQAVADAFAWWEGRFNKIHLTASNLPEIAHRRLLQPRDAAAAEAVDRSIAQLKAHRTTWDALMRDDIGSGEEEFRKVYPFSPALVNVLVNLSGLLQRERTALKVMAQLLSENRDQLTIDQIIPVADLFDALVLGDQQPLTVTVRNQFNLARDLYQKKFRPLLLQNHGLTGEQVAGLPRSHGFRVDDRLAKTLLVSALVDVPALADLTASKLAALNHGSIQAFFAGAEVGEVLGKVRSWSEEIGELEVGDGADPVIRLVLAGVDYESVLNQVQSEDTPAARRRMLKNLVFQEFGATRDNLLGGVVPYSLLWRGTKRQIDLVFDNIRDEDALPDDFLRAEGDSWRVIVDYPFDVDDHVPGDDVARFDQLRSEGVVSRTVGWVPRFLSASRRQDVGQLVLLEHLLSGNGDRFDAHSGHLPPEQRPQAKAMLENRRRAIRERLLAALKQAYGLAAPEPGDIDTDLADFEQWPTLWPDLQLQRPSGSRLKDGLHELIDQMLSSQFPDHPRFIGDSEIRVAELDFALGYVKQAVAAEGRVDPVPTPDRKKLKRVVNPLGCGYCHEAHYVFGPDSFEWRNRFVRLTGGEAGVGGVKVPQLRKALAGFGMPEQMQNLLIVAWALLDDKQFQRHGGTVQVPSVRAVTDDLVLVDPSLPSQDDWDRARHAASSLFGAAVSPMRTAANLGSVARQVRESAREHRRACQELVVQLEGHAEVLGLTAEPARLATARAARDLVDVLAGEDDDLGLVGALAGFNLPDEPQALAKSITSAQSVAAKLEATSWAVLDSTAGRASDPDPDPLAVEALVPLREAAARQELHASLQLALGRTQAACSGYLAALAGSKPTPPGPTPVPGTGGGTVAEPRHPDDVAIRIPQSAVEELLDKRVAELSEQIRADAAANSGRTLHISWWWG